MNNNQQNNNNNYTYPTDTTITYNPTDYSYGMASGVDFAENYEASVKAESLTFSQIISYIFAEYFKGLAFVVLTSVFILAVPKLLIRQGSIRVVLTNFIKRCMDVFGSITGLVLTLPIWLIIPVLIKITSPGPIFYTQIRVGQNKRKKDRRLYQKVDVNDRRSRDRRRQDYMGQTFKVFKFRTMVNDAEKSTGPVWATKDDPRITKLGNFLRKSRIDEIPQFINVLLGDMSLVGPRPERPEFVANLSEKVDGYSERLSVKPGLTGLAQVSTGYDDSVSSVVNKVRYDLEYINNQSIGMDIKILFKTVFVVLTGKGAN